MTDEERLAAGPPPALDAAALEALLAGPPKPQRWWQDWRWLATITAFIGVMALALAVFGLWQANNQKADKLADQAIDINALRAENECRSALAIDQDRAESERDDALADLDSVIAQGLAALIDEDNVTLDATPDQLRQLNTTLGERAAAVRIAREDRAAKAPECTAGP